MQLFVRSNGLNGPAGCGADRDYARSISDRAPVRRFAFVVFRIQVVRRNVFRFDRPESARSDMQRDARDLHSPLAQTRK